MLSKQSFVFLIVADVGFEFTNYTVNEDDNTAEVCIILRNPPPGFDIRLTLVTTEVTASKKVFLQSFLQLYCFCCF